MLTGTEINDCIEAWKRTWKWWEDGATVPYIYYESGPDNLLITMRYRNRVCKRILNNPGYIFLKHTLDNMWKEISCSETSIIDDSFNNYTNYIKYDIKAVCAAFDAWCKSNLIKDVIFNYPATIVFWSDGTKTVVQARDDDVFDPEKGLAMAIVKKCFGNKGNYYNQIKKWLPKEGKK